MFSGFLSMPVEATVLAEPGSLACTTIYTEHFWGKVGHIQCLVAGQFCDQFRNRRRIVDNAPGWHTRDVGSSPVEAVPALLGGTRSCSYLYADSDFWDFLEWATPLGILRWMGMGGGPKTSILPNP